MSNLPFKYKFEVIKQNCVEDLKIFIYKNTDTFLVLLTVIGNSIDRRRASLSLTLGMRSARWLLSPDLCLRLLVPFPGTSGLHDLDDEDASPDGADESLWVSSRQIVSSISLILPSISISTSKMYHFSIPVWCMAKLPNFMHACSALSITAEWAIRLFHLPHALHFCLSPHVDRSSLYQQHIPIST